MRQLLLGTMMMFLAGCQLLDKVALHPTGDGSQTCDIDDAQVIEWLNFEHRYVSSTLDTKRRLLIDAEKRQQRILHALLLSTPGQSQEQLKRALEYLSTVDLNSSCTASQYIRLRTRQLQLQLGLLDQNQSLKQQVNELQRQVDALTDLERQITRQREEH
ncbi:hypothetical protein [Marinobacterium sediminicola]|uniref:Lipoprotein n=1 Tax=Marinobacterium sediminicola TaxID=518898 RepID=A0ABY1RWR0_9GAMM|nr:hypothetical protein [Marinobacterium sediminicola]ULG70348.1 hypothetical protein LN244_05910 [Marinobacterium sediminicola]SMR69659.1 hypothetical protein SAMN04487964_101318 [Marinobacterium sediminicola]